MSSSVVPVIDISDFSSGCEAARRKIATQVAHAVEDIGFLTITGHGVGEELLHQTTERLTAFFDQPQTVKHESLNPSHNINRGYVPFGEEFTAASHGHKAPPDLREAIAFGRFDIADDPYYRHADASYAYEPNIWPCGLTAFESTIKRYYQALEQLNTLLLQIFANALDLEASFFLDKFDRHASVLRAINYPAQQHTPLAGQLRCGAHSDFGSHTLLHVLDAQGGLQVRNRAEQWVDVKPPAGSFVVNIGDLLMNWTNDRWLSNMHRVVNPPPGTTTSNRRQSIAFFVQPNFDALIECIPTCRVGNEEPKHSPVKAWEYRHAKLSAMTVNANAPPA